MSPTLDTDDADDDTLTLNTNETREHMTSDGRCIHHPHVELRGRDPASGQVYYQESCPECNAQHKAMMDARRLRRIELDRQLRALDNENNINLGTGTSSVDVDSSSVDVACSKGKTETSSSSSVGYSNTLWQQHPSGSTVPMNQHAASSTNGKLNEYQNYNGATNFPPLDSQYLPKAANTFHHVNMVATAATASQHMINRQDIQKDDFLWKLLKDKEDELKEVRKTMQQIQSQFQEQSLLATKLQTKIDSMEEAFERERLILKLQAEKETQKLLAFQQQDFFQKQLQWMEKNIESSRDLRNHTQRKDVGCSTSLIQPSDKNPTQLSMEPIDKTSVIDEVSRNRTCDRTNQLENVEGTGAVTGAVNVPVNIDTKTNTKNKDVKKYPWTETVTLSPTGKISTANAADKLDHENETDESSENSSNKISLKSCSSKKKLYPSIDETFMTNIDENRSDLKHETNLPQSALSNEQLEREQAVITTKTPTITTSNRTNYGTKTINGSSDRFEPLYISNNGIEEGSKLLNPDDRSIEQTVASSTYGDDRIKVVSKTLLDPYGDKGTFTGVLLRNTGMPHGQGKMVYEEDRRVFDGDWRHGRWHGYGRAFFSNGDSYEGEYKFDQRHGTGVYRWSDGRVYTGKFSEDKRHGKGKFKWPDGAVYEGDFVNGQRQGQGKYVFADGGQYDGSWKDGKYDGIGTCTWEDGRCYRGEWRTGMAHGKGCETYPDGRIRHEGMWIDDEPAR